MSKILPTALMLLLALVLVTPVALAEDPPVAPKPAGEGETTDDAPAKPKLTDKPAVKLIEAGAAPHAKLRYAPTPGSKIEFKGTVTLDINSPMGAMKMGPIKSTILVTFAKGTKDGQFKVEAEFKDNVLEDDGTNPYASMMKGGIEGMKGKKLSGEMTDRGLWVADPVKGAPSDQMSQAAAVALKTQFLNLLPPLPEEGIGVGGKWSTSLRIVAGNIPQDSHSTMTISKIEGGKVEMAFEEKRHAKDSSMSMMGQQIDVKSLEGGGKGTGVLDLKAAGLLSGGAKLKWKTTMDMMGQVMESSTDQSASVTGKPVKSAEPVTTGG